MKHYQGYIYALLAAIFNALIGVFSVKIMLTGLSPFAIAFYKCLIALVILTLWLIFSGQWQSWLQYLRKLWWQLAVTAFFGFFVLYFFETTAYQHEKVSIVVFMLLGSALLTTFILSALLSKKWLRWHEMLSCLLAVMGLGLIFGVNSALGQNHLGILLAILAGIGYGTFLTLCPKFNIGSGLLVINSLILFGVLYLFIPFAYTGFVGIHSLNTMALLLLLALLPTIGGFLCTTKALTLLKSESVQLIELSEPIFTLALALLLLNQRISVWQIIGGALLLLAIYTNFVYTRKRPPLSAQIHEHCI